jgi:peptidoglycan/LPS O-acetylase OafA/YrhL
MKYRKDVDGLRGLAVAAVVLFHAGFPGFSGGFVGVDIFFVISGFLITGIIVNEVESEKFTVTGFYNRRIRRIFPALISVYIFCFVAGLFIATPPEFLVFGESLIDSAIFISNHYFYAKSDYFDAAAHTKPLLHTWSLAVEEQFYLLWPVALLLLWKVSGSSARLLIIGLLGVVSLVYAEWEIAADNQAAAFYLLPARGWELMLGAVLAIVISDIRVGLRLANLLAATGLVLIVSSVALLSADSAFPGLLALPACLGTAMLIVAGYRNEPAFARLYSNSFVVFIGLISYSLYLWHWPIFSYWKLLSNRAPGAAEVLLLILLSVGLAVLSYRYIEQPFRKSHSAPPRARTLQYGAISILACVLLGLAASGTGGLPHRFGSEVAEIYSAANQKRTSRGCSELEPDIWPLSDCLLGKAQDNKKPTILLAGDSHAHHFAATLDALLINTNRTGQLLSRSTCLPLTGVRQLRAGRERQKCIDFFSEMAHAVNRERGFEVVVLAARWASVTEDTWDEAVTRSTPSRLTDAIDPVVADVAASRRVLERSLRRMIEELRKKGTQIVLMGQVPPFTSDPVSCVGRARMHARQENECFVSAEKVRKRLAFANELLKDLAAEYEGTYSFIPSEVLCDEKSCSPFLNETFIYRDDDHLNVPGAQQLARYLEKLPPFAALQVAHSPRASVSASR